MIIHNWWSDWVTECCEKLQIPHLFYMHGRMHGDIKTLKITLNGEKKKISLDLATKKDDFAEGRIWNKKWFSFFSDPSQWILV